MPTSAFAFFLKKAKVVNRNSKCADRFVITRTPAYVTYFIGTKKKAYQKDIIYFDTPSFFSVRLFYQIIQNLSCLLSNLQQFNNFRLNLSWRYCRSKTLHDITVLVHQEFFEIPLDITLLATLAIDF